MSSMRARSLLAMLVLCAASPRGNAQSTTRDARHDETSGLLTPGVHVRVKLPREHAWTGTLVSLAGDSMFVRGTDGADTTLVRLSHVTQLDVSTGKRRSRHLVRNTMILTGIGAGLGWVTGRGMTRGGCTKGEYCWEHAVAFYYEGGRNPPVTDHATAGTVIGGLAGGTVGLLVSRLRSEHWRPVSLARAGTEVSLVPSRGGVAIAYSARR